MNQNTEKEKKITFKKIFKIAGITALVGGGAYLAVSKSGREKFVGGCKKCWVNVFGKKTEEPVAVEEPKNNYNNYPKHGYGQKRPYWQNNKNYNNNK